MKCPISIISGARILTPEGSKLDPDDCIGEECMWYWKCKNPADYTPDEKFHASISNAVRHMF